MSKDNCPNCAAKTAELKEEREKDYCVFFHDVCDELKKSSHWNSVQGAKASAKFIVMEADKAEAQLADTKLELECVTTVREQYAARIEELEGVLKEVTNEKSVKFQHKMWCRAAKCAAGCGKLLEKKVFKIIERSGKE